MLTALCATLAHARRGEALSCVGQRVESYSLTAISVTVNGAPVGDLTPWQRHELSLRYVSDDAVRAVVASGGVGTIVCTLGRLP